MPPSKKLNLSSVLPGPPLAQKSQFYKQGVLVHFFRLSTNHLNKFLWSQFLHPFLFSLLLSPTPTPAYTLLLQPVLDLYSGSSCSRYGLWTSSNSSCKLVRSANSWAPSHTCCPALLGSGGWAGICVLAYSSGDSYAH